MRIVLTLNDVPLVDSDTELDGRAVVKALAAAWVDLADEEQADFFEQIAQAMEGWGAYKAETQIYAIGRHMQTCACVSEAGKDFVRRLAECLTLPVPL